MRYDPLRRHRRSIRLKGYNYARPGAYFVTICVQGRLCLLGEIVGGDMALNDASRMVEEWRRELPDKFPIVTTLPAKAGSFPGYARPNGPR